MRTFFTTIVLMLLAGCASTGVRVSHIAPSHTYSVPPGLTFEVVGDHEPTVSAARQALSSVGLNGSTTIAGSSSTWRLRADVFVAMETTRVVDTFCGHSRYLYAPGWYPYGNYYFGPAYPMACPGRVRTRTYPVRTVTWTAQDASGRALWQASAREANPAGPPVALSMNLAQSLNKWLGNE